MKRKFIPAEESFNKWKKDPAYAAYASLEPEFALASSLTQARTQAYTSGRGDSRARQRHPAAS
jgi:hypothetical protein